MIDGAAITADYSIYNIKAILEQNNFYVLIYLGMVAGSIEGSSIAFVLPWGSIGMSVLGVFIIIFITMLYAVSKIKKENIIDALRDDMACT